MLTNRTLYWRTYGDTLELTEISLNYDLVGNRVRYRFVDTPLLPGITVHESWGNVVVLVATVGSGHKLCFPHPTKLLDKGVGGVVSVLADATINTAREILLVATVIGRFGSAGEILNDGDADRDGCSPWKTACWCKIGGGSQPARWYATAGDLQDDVAQVDRRQKPQNQE